MSFYKSSELKKSLPNVDEDRELMESAAHFYSNLGYVGIFVFFLLGSITAFLYKSIIQACDMFARASLIIQENISIVIIPYFVLGVYAGYLWTWIRSIGGLYSQGEFEHVPGSPVVIPRLQDGHSLLFKLLIADLLITTTIFINSMDYLIGSITIYSYFSCLHPFSRISHSLTSCWTLLRYHLGSLFLSAFLSLLLSLLRLPLLYLSHTLSVMPTSPNLPSTMRRCSLSLPLMLMEYLQALPLPSFTLQVLSPADGYLRSMLSASRVMLKSRFLMINFVRVAVLAIITGGTALAIAAIASFTGSTAAIVGLALGALITAGTMEMVAVGVGVCEEVEMRKKEEYK